ncbi:MAG: class I SAM-dependent methyltransferase [Vicinamibacteria bacterium]
MNSTAEAEFEKYAQLGAYHWRDIGGHWIYHNAFNAERYRRVLRAAAPLAGFRVLDYGCGDGALLGWISRAVGSNGEAVGLEPNEEGRAAARHMLSRHSLPARLCASPQELESGSFDRVICSEVIEHVADVEGLLRDIHRVLKPDGLAVLTTPIRLTEVPEEPSHVREWFPSEFAALFEAGPSTCAATNRSFRRRPPKSSSGDPDFSCVFLFFEFCVTCFRFTAASTL